ncbi:MAG TPA: methylmalonyl Co-A mutase-associated GTPase MeaB [Anaerolineales bacterium]|nr:methylmalonyl Co-A mutase-associated GTPase MeaB [Anaerolineales bacterium]
MMLVDSLLKGDRLALARLLTYVENGTAEGRIALRQIFARTGRAHLVGMTGAPGTGKSSLVNRLTIELRARGKRVAIVAVDPTSPFTGGAVLGDRIRMKDLSEDADVFIRSMASRGALGGLAHATAGLVQVFDAAGYDIVLIETVGAGQSEVDVARLAHTTIVVEAPGLGDDIQAIKAGILEIADLLVINKADRPGVENTEKALRSMLELAQSRTSDHNHHGTQMQTELGATAEPEWRIPIIRTVATEGTGVSELADQIERHAEYLRRSGHWARRDATRLIAELDGILHDALAKRFGASLPEGRYNEVLQRVTNRELSPGEAVDILMESSELTQRSLRGPRGHS